MKHVRTILSIGVPLSIVLGILKVQLSIEDEAFWRYYLILGAAVILGVFVVNLCYQLSYQKKLQAAAALLNAGDAQGYIQRLEALKRTAKGDTLRAVLDINLAAVYVSLGQCAVAIGLLEPLCQKRMGVRLRIAHRLNLCLSYFRAGAQEQALTLYRAEAALFDRAQAAGQAVDNITLLRTYVALATDDREEAGRQMDALAARTTDPVTHGELIRLREQLDALP